MTEDEYNRITLPALEWIKKKDEYKNSRFLILGLRPKFYLLAFGLLLILAVLFQDADYIKGAKPKLNTLVIGSVLFEKPDNASTIIVKDIIMNDVIVKDTTKYYYHVELSKQGKTYFGYIVKNAVFESSHSSSFILSIEILLSIIVGMTTWILSKYFVTFYDRRIGQAQLLFRKIGWCVSAIAITLYFSYRFSFLFL